ncbi:MFS transporter [Paenibacillus mesophilus]|uniref:MFS transporter n=1 Tax=Paenibacillus mesophilus TaxID=2582849 RepID=UPI00110D38EE|nr:MFS transporter [Paenibacillus mesophilus]TMV48701.1 MFS transporter [Paenibacillus mesophilus]
MGIERRSVQDDRRLSREARVTLVMQGLFIFAHSMAGTFLSLYLWRLTHSLSINGIFNILLYTFTAVGFVVGGKYVKRKGTMTVYRLGIALISLFYFAVVAARERVVDYYPVFGVFLGLAGGFYWIGYWTLSYVVSDEKNRLRYIGLSSLTSTIATLAAPLTAAAIFSYSEGLRGYVILFSVALLVFLCAAAISTRIKVPDTRRKTYYLNHMASLVRRNASFRRSLIGNTLLGVKQGALLFLPPILLYQVLQGENKVGVLNAALSFLAIAASYLFSKYATAGGTKMYLFVTVTLYTAASLLLVSGISAWTVITFLVIHSICGPIKAGTYDGYYYRLIGTLPLKGELRVESMVIREVCWNAGRASFLLPLLLFVPDLETGPLAWIVLGAMVSQYMLAMLLDKRFSSASAIASPTAGDEAGPKQATGVRRGANG